MSPALLEDLGDDLALMARVVQSQLSAATTSFFQRDRGLAAKVIEKDDHVDNLLGLIEEKCFRRIAEEGGGETSRARQFRGVFRVALNLEKLGDYAVNIAEQATHIARFPRRPPPFDLASPTRVALAALDEVITSFTDVSVDKAKHACRCESELDRHYREALATTFERLRRPQEEPAFVITHLFVAKFLERVGDSILNIGETTLFILTGERLKLHQFLHLEEMVTGLTPQATGPSVDLRQIWGGISGARVGRLSVEGRPLLWKEGAERKIEEELREIEAWNRVVPGLAPDVKARHQEGGRESFLGQFLDGVLLRDVYLTRSWDEKVKVTRRLLETLRDVWLATLGEGPTPAGSIRQIVERLPELYAVHPKLAALRRTPTRIFGIAHRSLNDLLDDLGAREAALAPKALVRIHGDFNTNNVIYDPHGDRVHFIDVHRSGRGDYAQDIGVLLVSNLRSPLESTRLTREVEGLNTMIRDFAAEFAALVGDPHFETRLTLVQARSFITSARLVPDGDFAQRLYLQGLRLLERAARAVAA
jgi:phosphate uptake regulator/aminoglycoside phosphotransferase